MADVVDTKVVFSGTKEYEVHLLNLSDGTGESAVTKIDVSTLTAGNGKPVSGIAIEHIRANVHGMSVLLACKGTSPIDMIRLGEGLNQMDFRKSGGMVFKNTGSGANNVTLTTTGQVSGSTYDITLRIRLLDL